MHEITNLQHITDFILAGKASFTLQSRQTGQYFTYQVYKSRKYDSWNVNVLTGPDNYRYIGYILRNLVFCPNVQGDSAKAFAYFWDRHQNPHILDQIAFYHEGRCGKCGRPLTTPESIERGLGPYCAEV